MKSVAGITFHASHNYGSVLQAYALQTAVQALGAKYEILNFHTARQIDLYTVFTKRKGLKYLLKNASHAVYYPDLHRKWERFEAFIHNRLALSAKTFSSLEELEAAKLSYDCYLPAATRYGILCRQILTGLITSRLSGKADGLRMRRLLGSWPPSARERRPIVSDGRSFNLTH